jgi:hypothetical protein
MRKRKQKHLDLSLDIIDNQTLSAPAPDYGMTIKGTDMYWYPEPVKSDKNKDIIGELLDNIS